MPDKIKASTIIRYDDQAKAFVSYCPLLDLYSQGSTKNQALSSLCDTIVGWMFACYTEGVLGESLETRVKELEMMNSSEE